MENLTNSERYWLIGELLQIAKSRQEGADLFDKDGGKVDKAIAQGMRRDVEIAQGIVRKLGG